MKMTALRDLTVDEYLNFFNTSAPRFVDKKHNEVPSRAPVQNISSIIILQKYSQSSHHF